MLDVLTGFVDELRQAGLPVSLTESLDAAEALHHVRLEDREALKCALGATLVKSSAHWRAFETAFEVYFSIRGAPLDLEPAGLGEPVNREPRGANGGPVSDSPRDVGLSDEEFAELLYRAFLSANFAQVAALARQAVSRYAGMEPGRPVGGTYYLFRTLRNLDLDGLSERMLAAARSQAADGRLTSLEERLARDEIRSRLDQLRKEIEDEIRRRLVADRGTEALARSLRKPLPEDIDFMHATSDELAALPEDAPALAAQDAIDGLTDEDAVPALPETPVSRIGDLWILGDHKMLVGDTTNQDGVARLMAGDAADLVFNRSTLQCGLSGLYR